MEYLQSEWRTILKQGALLMLSLLIVIIGIYALVYQLSWASNPHWIEAHRDRWEVANVAENVHWFWIHEDSQYWIMRLRFDQGPVGPEVSKGIIEIRITLQELGEPVYLPDVTQNGTVVAEGSHQ